MNKYRRVKLVYSLAGFGLHRIRISVLIQKCSQHCIQLSDMKQHEGKERSGHKLEVNPCRAGMEAQDFAGVALELHDELNTTSPYLHIH